MAEKQRHTVLVVEDVDEISANMASALDLRGHHVMRAANADDAIQMAEVNRPEMILTDLDLPTFDKLLSMLRGHADLKNMVVAIIDINNPTLTDSSVNVLPDFQALDDLMNAPSEARQRALDSSASVQTPAIQSFRKLPNSGRRFS